MSEAPKAPASFIDSPIDSSEQAKGASASGADESRAASGCAGGATNDARGETSAGPNRERRRLPPWLRRPLGGGPEYVRVANAVKTHRLNTICEDAHCPNRGECWSRGTATFMIMGDLCTRRCGFCSVKTAPPRGIVDADEPRRLAAAAQLMSLRYVVVTSVDRDDLADRGAGHFAATMAALRERIPEIQIELLTPDFRNRAAMAREILLPHAPFVWGHNVETVPRLYRTVRPGSIYEDSLALLREAAAAPGIIAKSSVMLGLGETREEVLRVMDDLAEAGVERMTIGQYLRPTPNQLEVVEYIHPDMFDELAGEARARGIEWVISSPFARSSYFAEALDTGTDNLRRSTLKALGRE